MIQSSQYLRLTACPPSLAFISLHESAGRSGMEPSGTRSRKVRSKSCLIEIVSVYVIYFVTKVTSIPVSSEIISFRVRNKIFRSGFLGAVTQLTQVLGKDVVKTLASNVTVTFPQTHIAEWCSSDLLEDVSSQHHAQDGSFAFIATVLRSCFRNHLAKEK